MAHWGDKPGATRVVVKFSDHVWSLTEIVGLLDAVEKRAA